MSFKTWSELNRDAMNELRPNFGFRSWDFLSDKFRAIIWQYLINWFFDKNFNANVTETDAAGNTLNYRFTGSSQEQRKKIFRIIFSVNELNQRFKAKSYAYEFLRKSTFNNACSDFHRIFVNERENVVMELFSLYGKAIIAEEKEPLYTETGEGEYSFTERKEVYKWAVFDEYARDFNETLSHFGFEHYLTRLGFVPKIDAPIIDNVYMPVLHSLSHPQWSLVNTYLSESLNEYRKNTPEGYGTCVTKTVTAIQAFLQILVNGGIGSGEISKLIPIAQKKGLIPDDNFTTMIFRDIESTIMRERQETGDPHPRKEFANDKNAMLVLNLAMIFFRHCIL